MLNNTCVCNLDNLRVGCIQYVYVVDADDYVSNLKPRRLSGSVRFDGGHNNRARAMNPEPKFP